MSATMALVAAPMAAQPEVAERLQIRESVDVRLLHLDAVVTDRDDAPIGDLEPSDFELRVDGKRVRVTGVTGAGEIGESVARRLTLVVALDERHLSSVHRDHALDAIGSSLMTALERHASWVSVVALGDTLEALLPPTRDRDAVRAALDVARQRPVLGDELTAQRRAMSSSVQDVLAQLTRSGSSYRYGQAALGPLVNQARSYGARVASDTRRTLSSLEQLADALSLVPGRKAVLLVSDGLPLSPLDLLSEHMNDRLAGGSIVFEGRDTIEGSTAPALNSTSARPTGSDLGDNAGESVVQFDDGGAGEFARLASEFNCAPWYERVSAVANSYRVTFYPLKPPVTDTTLTGMGESRAERGSMARLSDNSEGLRVLAAATGGISFTSDQGLGGLVEAAREDVSSYYALAFEPPEDLPELGIREIELKVRRQRAKVRHRATYLPVSMDDTLARRAWGTLLFDWEENVHGLDVRVSAGEVGEALDQRPVDVLVSLPIGSLELVAGRRDPLASGSFRSVVLVRTGAGVRLAPRHVGFDVRIPKDDLAAARDQYYALRTTVDLPPGSHAMVVGLWEENSGRASFVVHRFEIGSDGVTVAAAGSAAVSAPAP